MSEDTGFPGLINPAEMNFVSKRWGWELWICNNERYCGKKIFIKQGHYLSYHYHEKKDEVLFIESGLINFTHDMNGDPETLRMSSGYAFHVTPNMIHQMEAIEDTIIYEFSTKHLDEDSFRKTKNLVLGKKVNLNE